MSTARQTAGVASERPARGNRLANLMSEAGLDSLLVTNLINVRYLTGFSGTNGACVLASGGERRLFLTDFRYTEQAERQVEGFDRVAASQDLLADLAGLLLGRAGFDDAHMTVKQHGRLSELLSAEVELVPAGGLVERLRAVKDPVELRAIVEAAKLADSIYEYVRDRGLAGRTERDVALDLEREMRERGAEDPAFPSIVASGAHAALPHASPRDVEIARDELVILDIGCLLDGYCSDCTRTLATGALDGRAGEIYQLVLRAQETALAAVVAGADCREVDATARDPIEAAGYGEHFGHGLGHGVGLEVHEGPRLTRKAEGELEAGNVVTVEPGVYLPGELGVRIEDLVAVTEDGCEILSGFPKSLVTADG